MGQTRCALTRIFDCRWIHHHYWGIGTCMLLLTLPVDSPAVQFCVNKFLWWAWWQSIVMILQNRRAGLRQPPAPPVDKFGPTASLTADLLSLFLASSQFPNLW